METAYPVLEAAVVGINVLDVINASNHAAAGRNIDWAMGDANLLGRSGKHATSVGAQNRICGKQGFERSHEMGFAVCGKNEVGRGACTIPSHKYRHLLSG